MVVEQAEQTKEHWVTQGKFYRRLKYLGISTERRNMRNWQERYVDVNAMKRKLGLLYFSRFSA